MEPRSRAITAISVLSRTCIPPISQILSNLLLYALKRPDIRALEHQVEPELARRFRVAQHALASLRVTGRASSYYSFEIHRAVDSGMFLSVIILCSSLLEIWLRDLLVIRKATQSSPKSKREFEWRISQVDREIEGDECGMSFGDILKKTRRAGGH